MDDKQRRLALIRARVKALKIDRKKFSATDLQLVDEDADESEPLDLVDMLELEIIE